MDSGDPQAGTSFTLLSITAVVLGGPSIVGGRGTALGTLVACVLVMLIQNAMNQPHVSACRQYVWTGLLTLTAVALYASRDISGRAAAWLSRLGLAPGKGTRTALR
jgi:ribose transport system ATP-binding protein